jgi:hypothetical protein
MAEVHRTTMTPTKLELLTAWLPNQPWYAGNGGGPQLSRAGGFRLDDPDGEVGIEFLVVADTSGDQAAYYQVPLTYRGAALPGAEAALVGHSEHGVLGTRWIYNGVHDPVLVAQLLALLQGAAEPQAQSQSFAPDPSVVVTGSAVSGQLVPVSSAVEDAGTATSVVVQASVAGDPAGHTVTIELVRSLRAGEDAKAQDLGSVHTGWLAADGTTVRGRFAAIREFV